MKLRMCRLSGAIGLDLWAMGGHDWLGSVPPLLPQTPAQSFCVASNCGASLGSFLEFPPCIPTAVPTGPQSCWYPSSDLSLPEDTSGPVVNPAPLASVCHCFAQAQRGVSEVRPAHLPP